MGQNIKRLYQYIKRKHNIKNKIKLILIIQYNISLICTQLNMDEEWEFVELGHFQLK